MRAVLTSGGADIAVALAHVHAGGVVHRDVKPSNVLLSPDGRALLGDFGVARLAEGARLTASRAIVGTVAYLAPEQLGGGDVSAAADVYAGWCSWRRCRANRRSGARTRKCWPPDWPAIPRCRRRCPGTGSRSCRP